MTALLRSALVATAVWIGFLAVLPAPSARADDYWNGYWGWYDNTYRPYTYRYYSRPYYGGYGYAAPAYGYYGPAYGGYYGGRYGYGRAYNYYGTPGVGVAVGPRGGGAVNVGPLQFGWR